MVHSAYLMSFVDAPPGMAHLADSRGWWDKNVLRVWTDNIEGVSEGGREGGRERGRERERWSTGHAARV